MVQLMGGAVETKADQAECADDDAVDFIEQPAFAQQPMRGFVKADQHAVHEMAGDEDERDGEPVVRVKDGAHERGLRERKERDQDGKGGATDPVWFVTFDHLTENAVG